MSSIEPSALIQSPHHPDLLCDYMGLPLSRAEVQTLLNKAKRHLATPPKDIASYANQVLASVNPRMLEDSPYKEDDFK